MRLGTRFLIAALLAAAAPPAALAQSPSGSLPWSAARVLPWTAGPRTQPSPLVATPGSRPAAPLPLTVHLAQDGALRITDAKGILRLRLGLPGRPLKLWRDWGTPVDPGAQVLRFPASTPLSGGIGALPVGAPDFRPALEGLLWILDDDEKLITVLHPATAQAVYLPLPGGRQVSLVFLPDRLEVQSQDPASAASPDPLGWSIPWLALLPQLIQLGQDAHRQPQGTALKPFPAT